jgi:CBS domain-containing protein
MQLPTARQLKARIEELRAIRDEIRLDLHLASMDLRDEWSQLERKLPEPAAAAELKEATSDALDRLAGELRRFRTRLRSSSGPRTVAQLMRPAVACVASDSLATAVTLMWNHDLGFLPVTDQQGQLVGALTDRDACIAACTRGRRMDELSVDTAMTAPVTACLGTDAVEDALALMRSRQVRRVPVIDADQKVLGVVSINDVARAAIEGDIRGVDAAAIGHALVAITRSAADTN